MNHALRLERYVGRLSPASCPWSGGVTQVLIVAALMFSPTIEAAGILTLNEVEVRANARSLIGAANSASEGTVLRRQLEQRTVYRPGELFETVPGLIVTQHSGEGKANQYFARGFNLDHGTDLRIIVDGMLVNQRSHGHGQGWADTNFLIPELASGLQYQKGPYYADQGDFSSAGAVSMNYVDKLPTGILNYGVGQQGFMRGLVAKSHEAGAGNVLYAFELLTKDGPWVKDENYRKFNGVLRYSQTTGATRFNITAMGYGGSWNSTDQIPERGVESGFVSRLGAIDPSDGGKSHRFSLSAALQHESDYGITRMNIYTIHTNLDLFSNFTYFLDDPVNGDQFSQIDKRFQSALNLSHAWVNRFAGFVFESTAGVQFQNDVIDNGLLSTRQRQTLSTTRRDHILENSTGLYYQNSVQWLEKFRTVAGVRSDYYWFDVKSDNPLNSGSQYDSITNPKLSVIFGPWANTEYYFNYGGGFHSNDARGTTITVDPKSGDPITKVNPLVRSTGYEAGLRTAIIPGLQASLAFFRLDLASELLFVGDAGTTEASHPSKREGVEVSAFYMPNNWLEKFRTVAGVRSDYYWFDVKSDNPLNSGSQYDSITNPKLSVIFGPWANTEYYFNYGGGFHSNDARGTTITVDPKSGDPITKVNPLVRSTGYEAGLRTAIIPGLQASLAFFRLDLASELLFVGDAGTTEASHPSKREGVEVSAFYMPNNWLTVDVDYALTKARFTTSDPGGNHIPGAPTGVGKLAIAVDNIGPFFGSMQFRYFGKRPLIEDNSVQSDNTMTVNGQIGLKIDKKLRIAVQVFNLLDTKAHAIDYYYTSRLPGEPASGAADRHFHPIESRSFRVNLVANF